MARPFIRLLAVLAALVIGVSTALPASAEAFRYWGYYTWSGGEWTFAEAGSSETVPVDGSVEGWRFAVADEASTRYPRAAGDFETLCGSTPAEEGSKRVGVVVDYGTDADAPEGDTVPAARGACAVVPEDATGSGVMVAVADLRLGDGGFICGIDGYPSGGCGDPVDGAAPSGDEEPVALELATAEGTDAATSWAPVAVAVGAVAVIGIAVVAVTRRRNLGSGTDA